MQESNSLKIEEPMIENITTFEITLTDLVPDSLYEFKVVNE